MKGIVKLKLVTMTPAQVFKEKFLKTLQKLQ